MTYLQLRSAAHLACALRLLRRIIGGVLAASVGALSPAFAQTSGAAQPTTTSQPTALNWSADDANRIAWLEANGTRETRPNAIVWAPRDSIAASWLTALADSLDRGIAQLRTVMGAPYPWQRLGARPVTFYLSPGRFVAHGSGYGAVFIPVMRVKERLAPFLHEASHELLAPKPPFYGREFADPVEGERAYLSLPLWLFEGIPDFLAQTAATQVGLHEGDVFTVGGLQKADSTCAARVRASPRGREVLDAVGRARRLEALFTTERTEVAPIFYACGQALTKYIVDQIGIRATVELMPRMPSGEWQADIARAAGRSMDAIRQAWISRIGLGAPH